ncbi:unnamed protein product, partial [Hymenolepis diminuta]|uniref:Protein kinase domain-containing protein n=1 Tax=Hymenolepis diminuta TaxID=6216 RepID=A0A158QG97_HYMDI
IASRANGNFNTSGKNFLSYSEPKPDSQYPNQESDQSPQFGFQYLRDMPDLVELSQKLQIRLAEAFKNSIVNHTYQILNPSNEAKGQQQSHPHGAYLTREAALRLSQRLLATITDSEAPFNVINIQKPTASQILSVIEHKPPAEEENTNLTTSKGISMDMVEDVVLLPPFKSSVSLGYRYRHGRLFQMASHVSPTVETAPPCISVPALRINLAEQRSTNTARRPSTSSASERQLEGLDETMKAKKLEEVEIKDLKPDQLRSKVGQTYLFEEAMVNSMESKLWTNMQFWEDLFLDTVAQERDLMGMDFDPTGLLQHYSQLETITKKRLELGEDSLLAGVMHNLIAFMVMARIPPDLIRRKIRRLIAKSHTGLHYTQKITQLLDCLEWLRGNDIDLLPIASRQNVPETFTVRLGWEEHAEMRIMEIYADFLLIRSMEGGVLYRWWYDEIINVVGSSQQNVIVFQVRLNKQRSRFLVTAGDSNALFTSIAKAINYARSKSPQGQIFEKLGGNVNVVDAETGEPGEIFLDSKGFRITFGSKSHLIPLGQVKACRVSDEDTFSFEVADHFLDRATWSLKTDVATVLLNQWERLIGVAETTNLMNAFSGAITPMSSRSRTPSTSNMNTTLER